jgi:phage shock protein PspC (stress-responsive transcriptional regulator)
MNKRLARSRTDVMLGGVCAGLANFLGIDPVIVRIFFILLVVFDGAGVLIYLLLWIVMPKEDAVDAPLNFSDRARDVGSEFGQAVSKPNPNAAVFIGAGLILAGIVVFLRSLGISWLNWLDGRITLPFLLLLAGGFLLYRAIKER